MISLRATKRVTVIACSIMVTITGCAFQGLNSLPLPGAVGRGADALIYHVEIPNIGTLESNSPVMIDDVVIGSVGKMTVNNWHADVEVSVRPDVVVPANAVVTVGQTSLLGSMHLALNPPLGEAPSGRLPPGSTIPLTKASAYPSTEQTLSSLSAVVNSGGLGQIGDIVHNFNAALSGHEGEARDLLGRLDRFIGVFDQQRDNVIASIQALNRLAGTLAAQRDTVSRVLAALPPALEVLNRERPRLTTALEKLGTLSDTATGLVNDTQADLVRNLQNLGPTIGALADVGPDINEALAFGVAYPFGQNTIDRGVRGDYMNLFVTLDLTKNRLKKGLLAGTRFGDEDVPLVPAPGDPGYDAFYSKNPLGIPLTPDAPAPSDAATPPPPDTPPPLDVPPAPSGQPGGGG
jgi:phospholipid/cholesterol/gamma-HCH transport system substrate-binding protein